MMSTAKQIKNGIKNVAGHQAKCIVVLGLVLKRDRHDGTKGKLPTALTQNEFISFTKAKHMQMQKF